MPPWASPSLVPLPATQAFAHPQARFLYEKMWQVSPRRSSIRGRLLGRINYVSYAGIHSAMAMGVVRRPTCMPLLHLPMHT